jgi:chorismate mutase/prephenate dehydratase
MSGSSKLDKAREIINRVDAEMAKLFEERMHAAETVAEYKAERGLAILDTAREEEIIRRGAERIESPILKEYYISFLKDTMKISRAYQSRLMQGLRVAYTGTEGAFAHIACEKLYPDAEKIAYHDFSSAYRAVESGECDLCVLPVENSFNGEVGQVTDLMFSGSLYVNGMHELAVTQDLLGVEGATLADIKKVISHPQALGQCAEYIRRAGFDTEEYSNTAEAARLVAEMQDRSVAAIASREAAERFSLSVLDHDINSQRNNTTRFAVFSRTSNADDDKSKALHSILLFTVRNEAGSLARALDVIGSFGFNMRTLRSRPMKELLWEYYFYIEVEGNIQTERGQSMLEGLSPFCDKLKFAGTYKKI